MQSYIFRNLMRQSRLWEVELPNVEFIRSSTAKKTALFIEYALAVRNPAEWDRAHKEGMASALFKEAKMLTSRSSETMRKQVLEQLGMRLTNGIDVVMSHQLHYFIEHYFIESLGN